MENHHKRKLDILKKESPGIYIEAMWTYVVYGINGLEENYGFSRGGLVREIMERAFSEVSNDLRDKGLIKKIEY